MHEETMIDFSKLIAGGEPEFIPLLTDDDAIDFGIKELPSELPILPLRGNVFFPSVVIPITAGREKSIQLIKEAYKKKLIIGVVAQRNDVDDPETEDLYKVGTIARIVRTLNMPDGTTMVIMQGLDRFRLETLTKTEPYWVGSISSNKDEAKDLPKNSIALVAAMKDVYLKLIKLTPNLPTDLNFAIQNIDNPYFLLNYIAAHLEVSLEEKQKLLEINDFTRRATKVLSILSKEVQMQEVKMQIQKKVSTDLDKQQRDYFLTQQLKTIQEELGGSPTEQAVSELVEKVKEKHWNKETEELFHKELLKLERMHSSSPDYSVQLNYLNFMIELPWCEYTTDNFDLFKAKKILDTDHYGLEKVKERIIEYLAVLKLKGDMKSPILCLVGPPGVGKTSLGKSVAKAIGRNYIRMALGGLNDESEIRGHRKTYIGAMPGRILKSINKAKSSNPVFVLDEIDKVTGMNINGDPSAAMLEVLDPEQNTAFHDNYLDIDYDLSRVMFLATANSLSTIQPALIDRMEVINIPGYIFEEKLQIAKKHLIPKQIKEHGMNKTQITINDAVISKVINEYTRESGVRQLEKMIAKLVRYRAVQLAKEENYNKAIKVEELHNILGLPTSEHDMLLERDTIGVVTGLAWTQAGGEILFIEASTSKGKGVLTLTGNLGDVMKESATLAYEYLKAHSEQLNIETSLFDNLNLHIHVPEGATPKDGPSAGITIFTAMVSIFTNRKVKSHVAMTGEITLRGKVLPVGGIKEKILAAKRSHITDIILSEQNRRDIEDITKQYIEGITFHYVKEMIEIPELILL
ncbi:MAG: endopeptidase La [Bacteroidales bacterium]